MSQSRRVYPSAEDKLRKQLLEHDYRRWSWVIYRCTYDDDDAWRQFIEIANGYLKEDLEKHPDLLECHEWKVFDDKDRFNNASKDQTRQHFLSWCNSAEAMSEQYKPSSIPPGLTTMPSLAPRYRYFIHVDAASLHSVVYEAPRPPDRDRAGIGSVAIVDSLWEMPDLATIDWDDYEEGSNPIDEGEEPVEGCRMYHVGWMRMGATMMGGSAYKYLMGEDLFYRLYVRPPEVWVS